LADRRSEQTSTINALVDRFYSAIVAGDFDALASLYAPGAVIWHNYDGLEQPAPANVAAYRAAAPMMANLGYDIRARWVIPDGCIQQHVMTATAPSGASLAVPMMVRFRVSGGLIERIEEYLDFHQVQSAMSDRPRAESGR